MKSRFRGADIKKRNFILFLSLWAASSALAQGGPRFSIGFRFGYFRPSATTFNRDFVGPLNQNLVASAAMLRSLDLTATVVEMAKIGWAADVGGEVEMFIGPVFSLMAGGKVWRETRPGRIQAEGKFMGAEIAYAQDMAATFTVLPVYVSARVNLYAVGGHLRFYAGAGAGYYWCRTSLSMTMKIEIDGSVEEDARYEVDAKGTALIPHLDAGVDVKLLGPLYAGLDMRYAFGKIRSFKITKSTDAAEVGQEYTYADAGGNLKPFVFELDGINVGLILKIKF